MGELAALGFVVGGLLGKIGWREAFWIVGGPGILAAVRGRNCPGLKLLSGPIVDRPLAKVISQDKALSGLVDMRQVLAAASR